MRPLTTMTWTAVLVLIADQVSKFWVVHVLDLKTIGTLPVAPPYLVYRMAWNEGVNFGLGSGLGDAIRWVLIAIALLISGWLIWWMRKDRPGRWVQLSAGLVIGGAIGNVIDRFVYGAVADFLNMSCCGISNPYAFNVADISIFVGAVGLAFLSDDGKKAA